MKERISYPTIKRYCLDLLHDTNVYTETRCDKGRHYKMPADDVLQVWHRTNKRELLNLLMRQLEILAEKYPYCREGQPEGDNEKEIAHQAIENMHLL